MGGGGRGTFCLKSVCFSQIFVTIAVLETTLSLVVNGGKLMSLTSILLTTIADSNLKPQVVLDKVCFLDLALTLDSNSYKNCLFCVSICFVYCPFQLMLRLYFICKFVCLVGLSVLSIFHLPIPPACPTPSPFA